MNTLSTVQNDWKDLYRAALFEPNVNKIPFRIAEAEKRIAARARELFHSGNHDTVERSALNVALYALFAFKSSRDWNAGESDLSDVAVAYNRPGASSAFGMRPNKRVRRNLVTEGTVTSGLCRL